MEQLHELCQAAEYASKMNRNDTNPLPSHPVIYFPAPLVDFILHICETARPGTILIVCLDQQTFLQHLIISTNKSLENVDNGDEAEAQLRPSSSHPLLERTLRLLAVSKNIRLAFCPSVAAFYAYVSTISMRSKQEDAQLDGLPPLAILNLVRIHRTTALFSAQGLGKAFATAVEAAWQTRRRLVLFEYPEAIEHNVAAMAESDHSDPVDEPSEWHDERDGGGPPNVGRAPSLSIENIWQEQVTILNAATKTFGNLGDRGWMGRTVKIIDVAARWYTVEHLSRSLQY